jgi:glycosyltransferase involved in cell wall biosynthesis
MDQSPERPHISKQSISVLLPFYNQAAGLEAIAETWLRALCRLERPFELIVIDDASTDESATIADKLATKHPEMRVLKNPVRIGYGACLKTGLAAATQPLIFYTACDYPYPPADVTKLLALIDEADLVTGCRTDPVPSWLRRFGIAYFWFSRIVFGVTPDPRPGWLGWGSWLQGIKLRLTFGLRVWDVLCAFKLFRRTVIERIPIQSHGEFVHAELLAKANFLGCLMAEVPIGRLPGQFKGVPEPPLPDAASDARRVFRRPQFTKVTANNVA